MSEISQNIDEILKVSERDVFAAALLGDAAVQLRQLVRNSGKTVTEIAAEIGAAEDDVRKWLASGVGLTLRSLSDIAWAAGETVDLRFVPIPVSDDD